MSLLLQLPQELLQLLFLMLPRQSVARLGLTSRLAYELCMPSLYSHIHLGFRAHVRQLESGLGRRRKLRETIQTYTKTLTLTNQQSSNVWLARDFTGVLQAMGGVRVLTLSDFDALSVDYLARIAAALPRIECLQLHYCNLTHELSPAPPFLTQTPLVASSSFLNTKRLSFCWTDFTQQAVASLLAKLPFLESIDLGANRNRVIGANTAAVQSLADRCPNVNELTISLQQVSESVLCDTIEHYGRQLHTLSIRCDGRDTLKSVAHHATHVKNLTIRASAQHPRSSSNASTTISMPPSVLSSPLHQPRPLDSAHGSGPDDAQEHDHDGSIVGILQRCKELVHLEMVSWMVQDVPTVVWRGIDAVAVRRRRAGPSGGNKKKLPSKTLALDLEELQEIRKQFVNRPHAP